MQFPVITVNDKFSSMWPPGYMHKEERGCKGAHSVPRPIKGVGTSYGHRHASILFKIQLSEHKIKIKGNWEIQS